MKKHLLLSFFILLLSHSLSAQFEWSADYDAFLDNREYENSYQRPQSFMGMWLRPEVGYCFGQMHHLKAGVALLGNFGSDRFLDQYNLRAYYHFEGSMFELKVGAFSRSDAMDGYSGVMLYDSISYFRPTMTGLLWRYKNPYGVADLYVDWTGSQTDINRETFLLGSTGKWDYKWFTGGWEFMLYHYAGPRIPLEDDHLMESGMLHLYAGVDLSKRWVFDILSLKLGYVQEFSRIRDVTEWVSPKGGLLQLQLDWQGIGVKNTLYAGDGQFAFYDPKRYGYGGAQLFWGDSYYHNPLYNRTDLYIYLIRNPLVSAYFDWSMHYAQGVLSHQQQFVVKVHIDQNIKKTPKIGNSDFIWGKVFRLK